MKVINNINILRHIAAAGEPELEHSASSEASSELASASLSAAEALERIPYARPYAKKVPYGFIMSLSFAASLAVVIGSYTGRTMNYLASELANLKAQVAELKKRKQLELSENQATQA